MINSHINKDLENCTGSGVSYTTDEPFLGPHNFKKELMFQQLVRLFLVMRLSLPSSSDLINVCG